MVRSADTEGLDGVQPNLPKPFSKTENPLRPTTTAAPGYPPDLIPRLTTRSITANRAADMPTVFAGRAGSPSDGASTTEITVKRASKSQLHCLGPRTPAA